MDSTSQKWRIEVAASAERQLARLDRATQQRIRRYLDTRLAITENPRRFGTALSGERLGTFWRYRVGDYRIIADIKDEVLLILVVTVGHRREVYR